MRSDKVLIALKRRFLGDAVMACPLIDVLSAEFERPVVQTGALNIELLSDRANAVRFLEAQRPRSVFGALREARALRQMRFSIAFLVGRSFRSALVARLAGIPERIGHGTEARRWLLTRSIPYPIPRFEAECMLDLARAFGIHADEARPKLFPSNEERRRGRELAAGCQVAIQPGARHGYKKLSIEALAEVGSALTAMGARIAIVGGAEERDDAGALAAKLPGACVNLAGKCSLRETVGVLSSVQLAVGSDTGVMHIAAAVGCPTVTVFGPEPPEKWGHAYPPHRILRAEKGKVAEFPPQPIIEACRAVLLAGESESTGEPFFAESDSAGLGKGVS